ncbi:AraC family transcriptional regulator [Oceanirhabdus sp. W0125-5]|uniref:AraC family transcriptional regulator n=1 Tax=Oceanirhabdus sp. W0125-5 TaxID=2999116 RepID=UPI0022F2CFE0|nr:effector binding domain-containing protein [Oceanirhabdus sp. W0125-5]WBW97452.1 effector binding domain-containing protein [Oceanirhabdus sp. W0125-5]
MDYLNSIYKAMQFIHNNYDENILVGDISDHVYLSPSYFSKVFRVLTGYTVKEYVNRYRLYRAATLLKETDKRIISIAFETGFSSQQSFTKKFVQLYRNPPARFRRINPIIDPFPPKNLFMERGITMDLKQSFDSVQFVTKESFLVVGIETDIDYNRGTNNIGDLYDQWNSQKLEELIPDQVNSSVVYGMTHESREDDTAKYMISVEVSTLDNLPSGLIARRFDSCEYAVFDTTLEMETSGEFWKYFFKTWLSEQGLEQPQTVNTKNKYTYSRLPSFEVYDADYKDETSKIKIYAPILRK